MSRDRLLLLQPGFEDARHPGERFVCPHCIGIEGLLAGNPELAVRLDIERLPYPRPRPVVIAALDADHQSLPALILGDGHPVPEDAKAIGAVRFVNDAKRILELLAERHGYPKVH